MSAFYQDAIKEFISDKLDENTKDILFNTILYNEIADDEYGETTRVENTHEVETKRKVPAIIASINGEYIPIPDVTATNNSVELIFDLAVDNMSGLEEEEEFESVDYDNSLLAIDEFRANVLSKYFPLGTSTLMFGGDDSELALDGGVSSYELNTIYLKVLFKNTDDETIFITNGATVKKLLKTGTKLQFYIDAVLVSEIDFEVDTVTELLIYYVDATDFWYITDGTNTDTQSTTAVNSTLNEITIGDTTGFEGVLHKFLADDSVIASGDILSAVSGDIDDLISLPIIDFDNFTSKDIPINNGDGAWTAIGSNIILWGTDGNAVFFPYPLTPLGEFKARNGINYQSFSLQLEVIVSDDIMFGNNVEYYLDSTRVYPVDRGHTLGTDVGSTQKINENYNKHVVKESSRDHSMTFFYKPTKQLTSLLKHIVTGSTGQNTIYELIVQYPFFKVTYDVVLENGGANPNLNTLSTFTVTFKRKIDILA